jgi:SAM-dependent methyltransferase
VPDLAEGFADPWEHIRLLSDERRNAAYVDLLARRAPGARVLEVGCGTGILSCIAARLGAKRVYAVEPTERIRDAQALIAANRLEGVVEPLCATIEELEPRPVDLAFSELLNADPFYEGVLSASDAAYRWVVAGGLLAPMRLRVLAAAVTGLGSTAAASAARRELKRVGREQGIDVDPVLQRIGEAGTHRFVAEVEELTEDAVVLFDVALGEGWRPPEESRAELPCRGEMDAVVVWFEAEIEPGRWIRNAPGEGGHWGQLVCGWTDPPAARRGKVSVLVEVEDEELTVHPG